METRTYNVYTFDELSDKAKAKALDNLRDINTDDSFWYEGIIEDATRELAEIGFTEAKIGFSGFYCQGDGASFSCSVDLAKWLEARPSHAKAYTAIAADADDTGNYSLSITKNGRYEHDGMMSVDGRYYGDADEAETQFDILCDIVLDDARDQARDIYKRLEKEYDYATSDESIKETIAANDYLFTEDGKLD